MGLSHDEGVGLQGGIPRGISVGGHGAAELHHHKSFAVKLAGNPCQALWNSCANTVGAQNGGGGRATSVPWGNILADGFQLALPVCATQLWALLWCFHGTALGLHGAYGANGGACCMVYLLILMLKAGPGGAVLDANGNNLFYLWVDCYSARVCADTTLEARASILCLSHYLH